MNDADDVLWMRPRKWREFQHYQDGRVTYWIKNYLKLDDPGSKFHALSWADQGRLQALWRLAARLEKDGLVPFDEQYLRAVLGDKRFTLASRLVTEWFHVGTQKELKKAANREKRSRKLVQPSSPEVRSKKKETPNPLRGKSQKHLSVVEVCSECFIGGGLHTAECPARRNVA